VIALRIARLDKRTKLTTDHKDAPEQTAPPSSRAFPSDLWMPLLLLVILATVMVLVSLFGG
jgi:hypothetical protein